MRKYFLNNWPVFALAFITLLLFLANYKPGTFLSGWDNLHPEFYPEMNIKRSIFAVWQEYQGLGLLGGMGHASDLLRQLILWLFSLIFPDSFLRYFWTFLMIFLGGLGAYKLIDFLATERGTNFFARTTSELRVQEKISFRAVNAMAFLGALFYILNLSTIQTFYAPFEAFTAHFAALPWLLFALISYLKTSNKKSLIFFFLISFIATPQAYIPTLFVVYLLTVSIILTVLFFQNKTKAFIFSSFRIYLITFLVNSFWLLPFLYFTFTNSAVNLNAKINQMATETIFLQNKEFGNIQDVMLLKGFWFNNVDPNLNGDFVFMMPAWREYFANPIISAIGYFLFFIVLLGLITALFKRRSPLITAFAFLFLFSFTMLVTSTFPFSFIDEVFRKIPLFDQAFRFPFTKFSILTSLIYSIFFAFGIQFLLSFAVKGFRIMNYALPAGRQELRIKKTMILYSLFFILLIVFTFPAFRGNLIYNKEKLIIPKEYFDLFAFFKNQDQNTRIANFPQASFWGWTFYNWGYGGSGFLWYGIKQPIIDRAFDVWGKENENYYFEISNALYARDPVLFKSVLNKYQASWLLVDKNVINPSTPKALFFPELEQLVKQIPAISKEKEFGNIDVYKVDLDDKPDNFVFITNDLQTANSYKNTYKDQAYLDLGNYKSILNSQFSILNSYYPFRSLFSNKAQKDLEFNLQKKEMIEFKALIPANSKRLKLPSFLDSENIISTDIYTKRDQAGNLNIVLALKTPQIYLENEKIWGDQIESLLFSVVQNPKVKYPLNLNINGAKDITIENKEGFLETTFLSLKQDNIVNLSDNNHNYAQNQMVSAKSLFLFSSANQTELTLLGKQQSQNLTVKIPIIKDGFLSFNSDFNKKPVVKNCDGFRKGEIKSSIEGFLKPLLLLTSKNATACTSFYIPNLSHKEGYAVFIESQNKNGRGLHFWLLNEDEKHSPIDTFLPSDNKTSLNAFILPPQDSFGQSYTLNFDNISIGNSQTINALKNVEAYPIPYSFLTGIALGQNTTKPQVINQKLSVDHPNESLYVVKTADSGTLVLSQSFNEGWKAYQTNFQFSILNFQLGEIFPFLFGKELKDHVLVNNWANGWKIDNYTLPFDSAQGENAKRYTLVIIYLPQYLEFLGFFLLVTSFVYIIVRPIKKSH